MKPCVTFHNKLVFYGEELLAIYPTLKLEDHPLLLGWPQLFIDIFAATLHVLIPGRQWFSNADTTSLNVESARLLVVVIMNSNQKTKSGISKNVDPASLM
jgi:hypothetical protein